MFPANWRALPLTAGACETSAERPWLPEKIVRFFLYSILELQCVAWKISFRAHFCIALWCIRINGLHRKQRTTTLRWDEALAIFKWIQERTGGGGRGGLCLNCWLLINPSSLFCLLRVDNWLVDDKVDPAKSNGLSDFGKVRMRAYRTTQRSKK